MPNPTEINLLNYYFEAVACNEVLTVMLNKSDKDYSMSKRPCSYQTSPRQAGYANTLSTENREAELPIFEQTIGWLDIYFSGKIPDFTPPPNLRTTEFRKAVCEIMLTIPYP